MNWAPTRPSPPSHADWSLGSAEPTAQPTFPDAGEGSRLSYTARPPFLGIPNGIPSHDTCGRVCVDALGAPDAGLIHATYRAVDGGHGRSEIRLAGVSTDAATRRYRDPDARWPDLHGSGLAQAERRVGWRAATRRAPISPV